jgi:hypothetical protein
VTCSAECWNGAKVVQKELGNGKGVSGATFPHNNGYEVGWNLTCSRSDVGKKSLIVIGGGASNASVLSYLKEHKT